jgi:hypothetical protein
MRRDKLLFFEAYFLVLLSNVSVKTVPFKYIVDFLHSHWNDRNHDALVRSDDTKNEIKLVDLSLSRALNVLPWNSLCLSRSIAQLVMLRRRGIPAVLFAGVKSREDSSLYAHAWVRAGDGAMDGNPESPGNAEFAVLVRIGQESLPN